MNRHTYSAAENAALPEWVIDLAASADVAFQAGYALVRITNAQGELVRVRCEPGEIIVQDEIGLHVEAPTGFYVEVPPDENA
ncbi:hypothetical protein [Mesorhizobium sp. M0203]|uniref:hypothetical protein n=1 Tax=Mesorhizobium sp. M0203 TaxID=2956912 RepID=UPI0033362A85